MRFFMSLKGIVSECGFDDEFLANYFSDPVNIEAFLQASDIFPFEKYENQIGFNENDSADELRAIIDEFLSDKSDSKVEVTSEVSSSPKSVGSHDEKSAGTDIDEEISFNLPLVFAHKQKKRVKRDPLEIDTVEGKKIKDHQEYHFKRQAKDRAMSKIKGV